MLTLTRSVGETIRIGDDIEVHVVEVRGGTVRLGFKAPREVTIHREEVYRLVGQYSRDDANGVPQVCFMGVINPLDPEVETAEQVRDQLLTAAEHIPVERLGATDDCGFSPFSRDVKPKHGSPDFARDIAMRKIAARLEGAELARRELGVTAGV